MNRYYLLSLLGSCIISLGVTGQIRENAIVKIFYNTTYIVDTTMPEKPDKFTMVLAIGKSFTSFKNFDAEQSEIRIKKFLESNPTVTSSNRTVFYGAPHQFYNDLSEKTFFSIAQLSGISYVVKETYTTPKWNISAETKKIEEYTCQKASTDIHGRTWEAWFCPELPYPMGPWKLNGLPGLILEAYDLKKEIQFTFKSINDSSASMIDFPQNASPSTLPQIIKAIEAHNSGARNSGASQGIIMVQPASVAAGKRKMFNNFLEKTIK